MEGTPWEAVSNLVRDCYRGFGEDGGGGHIIAECPMYTGGAENARLIAAAPELLDACNLAAEAIRQMGCSCAEGDGSCLLCNAYAEVIHAITKATNEDYCAVLSEANAAIAKAKAVYLDKDLDFPRGAV